MYFFWDTEKKTPREERSLAVTWILVKATKLQLTLKKLNNNKNYTFHFLKNR